MPVLRKTYLWDPLEPAATRILAMGLFDETGTCAEDLYYTHDLLKNTTALFGIRAGRRALYEYGPYGNILRMEGNAAEDNPFRFSSEYADDELGLVYYNYRYYNPQNGRWISREPAGEIDGWNLYSFVNNKLTQHIDFLGFQAIDASLLGTGPTNSVGAATLIEPAKVALAAGVIAAAGTVAIVSKESLQRSMMRSGVKVEEILKELKPENAFIITFKFNRDYKSKSKKNKNCCDENCS